MKRLTVVLFTLVFASNAWADESVVQSNQSGGHGSTAGSLSASGAGASAVIDASDRSTFNGAEVPDGSNRVPDVNVITPSTANNCALAGGGAMSIAGFGGGASWSYESEDCNRRADSQHAAALGQREVAREIACGGFDHYKANIRLFKAGRIAPEDTCLPNKDFDAQLAEDDARPAKGAPTAYIMGGSNPDFAWQHQYD